VRVFVRARAAFAFSLPNEVFLSIFPGEKTSFLLDMFPSSTASSRATPSSPLLLREGKRREQRQRRLFFFSARNDGKTSASSSSRASFLTAARGGEEKNGNEDDGIEEATKTKRKSLVAATTSAATMMMTTTTTTTAFACEEAVSSLAEGTNGTLESVRLVVALSSIALILFQGPKGDGVVNTLSEKRVFSSAKNAKSAVDYVTYALIGGFIVLSAVLAVG
jgi:preprotein translocase subunit SecG